MPGQNGALDQMMQMQQQLQPMPGQGQGPGQGTGSNGQDGGRSTDEPSASDAGLNRDSDIDPNNLRGQADKIRDEFRRRLERNDLSPNERRYYEDVIEGQQAAPSPSGF